MTLHNSLVVVLAAGEGTRMRSRLPKVAHRIAGRAMIGHVLASATAFGSGRRAVVIGPGMDEVEALVRAADPEAEIFVQRERLGTAHAVLSARSALERGADHVFVLFGDTPLVRPETLRRLSEGLAGGADIVVLGFRAANPTGYGRLLVRGGGLEAIREERDASPEERKVDLCNSGVMAIAGRLLPELLDSIDNDNAKKEFYLTDIVALARARGLTTVALEAEESEVQGINTRTQLAEVEAVLQRRLRAKAMDAGVTLIAPDTVFLAHDTVLGADVIVEPNVFFGEGVTVGEGTVIHAFSHLVEVTIDAGAAIGPFARLRPGADIGPGVKIGNFVEVKAARIEAGAKVPHLSYVGNARIGPKANIGAGTITCNYDGFRKHHTDVGAGAFVGSNSSLVAPVSIGDGAYIGSGSVITKNVTADALAVGRAQQVEKPGWAKAFREKMLTILGKTAKHSMK